MTLKTSRTDYAYPYTTPIPRKHHVRIKYLDDECKISKIEQGDWIDLRSRVDMEFQPFQLYFIPLGICMEIPAGYEALIVPRSSLAKRHGLIQANTVGVIDNSYNGDGDEWGMWVLSTREDRIEKGERICQFRIIENQLPIDFYEVEELGNDDRGGWGSTGAH